MKRLINAYSTYEASKAIAAVAAGAPIAQVAPNPSAPPTAGQEITMGLTRLEVVLTTAVAGFFGLTLADTRGTPTAPGTQSGTFVSSGTSDYSPSNGTVGRLLSLWSAAPTINATKLRQAQLPATIGASVVWTWPEDDPFTINLFRGQFTQDPGILLVNLSGVASPAVLVNARWSEFNPNGTL